MYIGIHPFVQFRLNDEKARRFIEALIAGSPAHLRFELEPCGDQDLQVVVHGCRVRVYLPSTRDVGCMRELHGCLREVGIRLTVERW